MNSNTTKTNTLFAPLELGAVRLGAMKIHKGRWTVRGDDDVVVFIIGMRINKPWKVSQWWPVFSAMPKMLKWLDAHPQAGLLGTQQAFKGPLSPIMVQYWRSFEDLENFARSPEAPHLPAWKAFNASVRDSGDVGIWHETYRVSEGQYESIYHNMPPFGLGEVGRLVSATGRHESAAQRMDPGTSLR